MEPTLLVGDRLFVTKYSYGYSKHSFPFSPPIFKGRIFDRRRERKATLSTAARQLRGAARDSTVRPTLWLAKSKRGAARDSTGRPTLWLAKSQPCTSGKRKRETQHSGARNCSCGTRKRTIYHCQKIRSGLGVSSVQIYAWPPRRFRRMTRSM